MEPHGVRAGKSAVAPTVADSSASTEDKARFPAIHWVHHL